MESDVMLKRIAHAHERIKGDIVETPLMRGPHTLNDALGFTLWIKDETAQPTHSFKVRGAFNQIRQLTKPERCAGVAAVSSGNHAQAVAYAAKKTGVAATILMPADAPAFKLDATRSHGATVITYDRATQNREALANQLASERGLRLIHPFDALRTIAGQGTMGWEIAMQTKALGFEPDAIIVPCSGGGLVAGIALTAGLYKHQPQIFAAEPMGFDYMTRSLALGSSRCNAQQSGSICDALLAPEPGKLPLDILRRRHAQGLITAESNIMEAMRLARDCFNLRLEPGGAAALACACLHRNRFLSAPSSDRKNIVVAATGGNISEKMFDRMTRRPVNPANMVLGPPSC